MLNRMRNLHQYQNLCFGGSEKVKILKSSERSKSAFFHWGVQQVEKLKIFCNIQVHIFLIGGSGIYQKYILLYIFDPQHLSSQMDGHFIMVIGPLMGANLVLTRSNLLIHLLADYTANVFNFSASAMIAARVYPGQ